MADVMASTRRKFAQEHALLLEKLDSKERWRVLYERCPADSAKIG